MINRTNDYDYYVVATLAVNDGQGWLPRALVDNKFLALALRNHMRTFVHDNAVVEVFAPYISEGIPGGRVP